MNSERDTGRKAPLFHGYKIRMPELPFGRKNSQGPADPSQQTSNRAAIARQSAGQPGQGMARGGSMPAQAAAAPRLSPRVQDPNAARIGQAGNNNRPAPAQPRREPQRPAAETNRAAAAPAGIEPRTAADRLVMQAHEMSAEAGSEEDFSRIIETCRRARASQPSPPVARYANELASWAFNRRGQIKAEDGRTREALLDFDDAIRSDPNRWRALHNRGVLLAQDGQFEAAFDAFNRTIQINPEFAKAYSNRAALFVVANDLSAALRDYQRAIERDANLAVAHRGCGRVCHLLGRLEEAIDQYDAAVQLAPQDAYALACRADLLTDLGRYTDAAAEYERAIEIDPQSMHAHSGSAWLLATCPDSSVRSPDVAIERARKAIELGGNEDAASFDALAAAQAASGDFAGAMQAMREAIQLAPAEERDIYKDRLLLYQRAKPYRIAPVRAVAQASYEVGSRGQGTGDRVR